MHIVEHLFSTIPITIVLGGSILLVLADKTTNRPFRCPTKGFDIGSPGVKLVSLG